MLLTDQHASEPHCPSLAAEEDLMPGGDRLMESGKSGTGARLVFQGEGSSSFQLKPLLASLGEAGKGVLKLAKILP